MNEQLAAAISGIVEGITEFLPISSTGHLIVTSELLNFDAGGAFEVIIQLGAVLAVIWYYRAKIAGHVRAFFSFVRQHGVGALRRGNLPESVVLVLGVIVAFLPAALAGFLLGDAIEAALFNPTSVAIALIVGGIVLWLVESRPKSGGTPRVEAMNLRQALLIGCAQLFALWPGMSRSASTIIGGMFAGLSRSAATEFSFYLSIPTLGAASVYSMIKDWDAVVAQGLDIIAIGMGVSFVVSLLAIAWLLNFIAKNDFKGFAIYRIIAGIAILIFFGVRGGA